MHGNRKWKHATDNRATYGSWVNMRLRCYSSENKDFSHYGGGGILVCPRWRDDFDAFFEDRGARPKSMTLERENNAGNYEPENCQWVSRKTQARNRRRKNLLEIDGTTKSIAEWAEQAGLEWDTLAARAARGETGQLLLRSVREKS